MELYMVNLYISVLHLFKICHSFYVVICKSLVSLQINTLFPGDIVTKITHFLMHWKYNSAHPPTHPWKQNSAGLLILILTQNTQTDLKCTVTGHFTSPANLPQVSAVIGQKEKETHSLLSNERTALPFANGEVQTVATKWRASQHTWEPS